MQDDLAVIRSRDALVRSRTLLINDVRGIVKSAGGRLPACRAPSFHKRAVPHVPPQTLPAVEITIQQIGYLTGSIAEMDKRVAELAATRYPQTGVLTQIPGVGTLTARSFVLTIGEPQRFSSSRKAGAYLGLVRAYANRANETRNCPSPKRGTATSAKYWRARRTTSSDHSVPIRISGALGYVSLPLVISGKCVPKPNKTSAPLRSKMSSGSSASTRILPPAGMPTYYRINHRR